MMAALAVVAYTWHKARRKAQAEVAFDAALQDSGLGLDDAFEQVSVRQETTPANMDQSHHALAADACYPDIKLASCLHCF